MRSQPFIINVSGHASDSLAAHLKLETGIVIWRFKSEIWIWPSDPAKAVIIKIKYGHAGDFRHPQP